MNEKVRDRRQEKKKDKSYLWPTKSVEAHIQKISQQYVGQVYTSTVKHEMSSPMP